ncbi:MAG TPA: type II toxin-antitoxin system HicB family antitoxin [Chthonomonadaceae bacterium]|nr:type II toxin-antitoxin system HicB family antitoxin [Chthonomonadaceae bacterium]
MDKYKVIVWWSPMDRCYLAEMPELPGCMADGATQEEALVNIREIAQEWVNYAKRRGRPIPQPEALLALA